MYVFVINNKVILDLIENLAIEEKIKNALKDLIFKFNNDYISFIKDIFSFYTTYYFTLTDENSGINEKEARKIYNKFILCNIEINLENTFVVDVYDILYATSSWERYKFKDYFYEDMFNRLESIYGTEFADLYREDIFELIENIFSTIEENMIFDIIKSDKILDLIVIYIEQKNSSLIFYVL